MKMDLRSIAIAGAILVMSSVAGFAQDWTKSPQDWGKSSQSQTQNPGTPAQTPQPPPQVAPPQIPQNRTQPPQHWTPPPPAQSEYQTPDSEDGTQKLYTHVDFGGSYQQDTTLFQATNGIPSASGNAKFNLGMRGNLAAGYNFNKSWAAEFDTGVIWNSMDSVGGSSLNQPYPFNQSFDTYTIPLLVNVIYKVPLKGDLRPYVSAGFGGSAAILSYTRASTSFIGSDFVFAYQAEVGLKYRVTQNASFGIAYQFLGTTDPSWNSTLTVGLQPPTNYQFKEKGFYTHSISVNFTWVF